MPSKRWAPLELGEVEERVEPHLGFHASRLRMRLREELIDKSHLGSFPHQGKKTTEHETSPHYNMQYWSRIRVLIKHHGRLLCTPQCSRHAMQYYLLAIQTFPLFHTHVHAISHIRLSCSIITREDRPRQKPLQEELRFQQSTR